MLFNIGSCIIKAYNSKQYLCQRPEFLVNMAGTSGENSPLDKFGRLHIFGQFILA